MRHFFLIPIFLSAVMLSSPSQGNAQEPEPPSASLDKPSSRERDVPKSMKEMLFKMQLEKEKKDYQEMLDRGEEVAKLTKQIEKSVETNGSLTAEDLRRVEDVERLVKKIRGELGGSDGDDDVDGKPKDVVSGVKYLSDITTKLLDELKNGSRFTISAAAIQSSNAVLKLARFLRVSN